jgi:hypothetical protein
MDELGVFVLGGFVLVLAVFIAIGRYYPGSGAQQVDWRRTRWPELEAELELDDIDQMVEAQNRRRRATGREEISEQGVRSEVEADERRRREHSERYSTEVRREEDLGS